MDKDFLKPIYCAFPNYCQLLPDKNLIVNCHYVRGNSLTDTIRIAFLEGPMIIEGELFNVYNYKIVSKGTNEDGDYFYCKLIDRCVQDKKLVL